LTDTSHQRDAPSASRLNEGGEVFAKTYARREKKKKKKRKASEYQSQSEELKAANREIGRAKGSFCFFENEEEILRQVKTPRNSMRT